MLVWHLVKLVDAAHASISENYGTRFERLRSGPRITHHGRRETGGRDGSTAHVNRSRREI